MSPSAVEIAEIKSDTHNGIIHTASQADVEAKKDAVIADYIKSNPTSQKAFERAKRNLPGGNTRSVLYSDPFPLVIKSGRDCFVTSLDGGEYLDFLSDFSAGFYGHSHPVVKQAVTEALETGFSLGGLTEKESQLAEMIKSRFSSIDLIRFCNSGTEANTMALASAIAFTGRKKILVFDNGYHGGTISFSNRNNPINLPHEFVFGEYNNGPLARQLVDSSFAAILVEPMMGAGGMIAGDKEFLILLREVSREVGAVLIFDEVITSRLHINGLQGMYGITPDMTTLGKYIGGGFSFGAFGGKAEIMNLFSPSGGALSHAGTFNNNIFTMTAAVKTFELVTKEEIERVNELGNLLRDRGNEIAKDCPLKLTGIGSTVGFQFVGENKDLLRDTFYFFLLQKGIMIGRRGFVSLNLVHERSHIEKLLDTIREFVEAF